MAHPTISEIIERRLISGDPEIVPTADEPVRAVDVLGPFRGGVSILCWPKSVLV